MLGYSPADAHTLKQSASTLSVVVAFRAIQKLFEHVKLRANGGKGGINFLDGKNASMMDLSP